MQAKTKHHKVLPMFIWGGCPTLFFRISLPNFRSTSFVVFLTTLFSVSVNGRDVVVVSLDQNAAGQHINHRIYKGKNSKRTKTKSCVFTCVLISDKYQILSCFHCMTDRLWVHFVYKNFAWNMLIKNETCIIWKALSNTKQNFWISLVEICVSPKTHSVFALRGNSCFAVPHFAVEV